jgi:hypothetical protein
MTLSDLVDEYLRVHQAAPVTVAKLRRLLRKATVTLGETCLAELSPRHIYASRLTIPEGHRFEATQALRQVSNRAVDWGLISWRRTPPPDRPVCIPGLGAGAAGRNPPPSRELFAVPDGGAAGATAVQAPRQPHRG